jgi:7-cyano-7-deazaguanine synthase
MNGMAVSDTNIGVVLISGGLDSLVTLAIALKECETAVALHASYGQRTAAREKRAFDEICDYYGIDQRQVINMDHIAKFGASSLTNSDSEIPAGPPQGGIPTTYVPFRNANLLAAGVSWAEAIAAEAVYIGVVEQDSSGYPDCRRSFIQKFQRVVEEGTRPDTGIMIRVPLISLGKDEIVRLGTGLNVPFDKSWSCYKNDGDIACGACESCLLRLRGFEKAGIVDPLEYEDLTDEAKKFIEF